MRFRRRGPIKRTEAADATGSSGMPRAPPTKCFRVLSPFPIVSVLSLQRRGVPGREENSAMSRQPASYPSAESLPTRSRESWYVAGGCRQVKLDRGVRPCEKDAYEGSLALPQAQSVWAEGVVKSRMGRSVADSEAAGMFAAQMREAGGVAMGRSHPFMTTKVAQSAAPPAAPRSACREPRTCPLLLTFRQ